MNFKIPNLQISSPKIQAKLICSWLPETWSSDIWQHQKSGNECFEFAFGKPLEYYDCFIVVNAAHHKTEYIPSKTIFVQMEPFIDQNPEWNVWYTDRKLFLLWMNHDDFVNNNEWHLSLNKNQLEKAFIDPNLKTHKFSTVTSGQFEMENHQKRIEFIKKLSHSVEIDCYGRNNPHNILNHRGSLPDHQKDNGLIPYKYSFAAENTIKIPNYYTEKLIDCILSESLCFYSGSESVAKSIDPKSFISIDLYGKTVNENIDFIKSCIDNNEWEKRLAHIRKMKKKILQFTQFYPRFDRLFKCINGTFTGCSNFKESLKIPRPIAITLGSFNYVQIDKIPQVKSLDFVEKLAGLSQCFQLFLETSSTSLFYDSLCMALLVSCKTLDSNHSMNQYKFFKSNAINFWNENSFDLLVVNQNGIKTFDGIPTCSKSKIRDFLIVKNFVLYEALID